MPCFSAFLSLSHPLPLINIFIFYFLGGAIYSLSPLRISDSNFLSNTANSGGAIFASGSRISATGTYFSYNKATRNGGAVYAESNTISFSGCHFTENSAVGSGVIGGPGSGSAIRGNNSTVSIVSSTFSKNGMYLLSLSLSTFFFFFQSKYFLCEVQKF